jgi:large subunit ribosomal protein L33
MATIGASINIGLKCVNCAIINYTTSKNPKTNTEKFEIKKHCPRCKTHTLHKEAKLKNS